MFDVILEQMNAVAASQNKELLDNIQSDSILLELGLDSLSFAILVVELEELLGFDPFQLEEDAIYPSTMGEFVALYEKHTKLARSK